MLLSLILKSKRQVSLFEVFLLMLYWTYFLNIFSRLLVNDGEDIVEISRGIVKICRSGLTFYISEG